MEGRNRTEIFVESFEWVSKYLGESDPCEDRKSRVAESVNLKGLVKRDLRWMLELSAMANSVDVLMPDYQQGDKVRLGDGVAYRTVKDPVIELEGAERIALLLDNAGEHLVDLKLAELLEDMGKHVTLVVRSLPYEVDVTPKDLGSVPFRVLETGSRYTFFYTLLNRQDEFDAIISKGIANLESLMDVVYQVETPVITLFRAKCAPLARLFNVTLGEAIISDLEYVRGLREAIPLMPSIKEV